MILFDRCRNRALGNGIKLKKNVYQANTRIRKKANAEKRYVIKMKDCKVDENK